MIYVVPTLNGLFRVVNSGKYNGLYSKYKVVKGDTLSKIAALTDTTVEFLAKVNDIKNVDLIEIDQELLIPEKQDDVKENKETINVKTELLDH